MLAGCWGNTADSSKQDHRNDSGLEALLRSSEHPGQESRAASTSTRCGNLAVGLCSLAQDATSPLGQIRRVPG